MEPGNRAAVRISGRSPAGLCGGAAIATLCPVRASANAAARPAGPPPTTTASNWGAGESGAGTLGAVAAGIVASKGCASIGRVSARRGRPYRHLTMAQLRGTSFAAQQNVVTACGRGRMFRDARSVRRNVRELKGPGQRAAGDAGAVAGGHGTHGPGNGAKRRICGQKVTEFWSGNLLKRCGFAATLQGNNTQARKYSSGLNHKRLMLELPGARQHVHSEHACRVQGL